MRRFILASTLVLSACATAPQQPQIQPQSTQAAPAQPQTRRLLGLTAQELVGNLGNPQLQVREGNSLVDKTKRAAKLREAETLLVRDEVPILPIFFYQSIHFWKSNEVHGIYYNILDEHPLHAIGKIKTKS